MSDRGHAVRPDPVVTDDSAPFWRSAADGRLVAQRCRRCSRLHHPPRPMCPSCGSTGPDWVELKGRGVVYSFSVLHHPRHPAFEYPVIAALIDLEEGVRMLSNLVDLPIDAVRVGMPVEVVFAPTAGDMAVPLFRPILGP